MGWWNRFWLRKPVMPECSNPQLTDQRRFTLAEILSGTGGFSADCLIGEGGCGEVYKATIGGVVVAVKRQKRGRNADSLTRKGFLREIEALTKLRHRNIITLKGYCIEENETILVYEYISNGTLKDHLHGRQLRKGRSLTWIERLGICVGACRGLEYLHTCCPDNLVLHRDVKTENILVDIGLVAKISDFGSAKLIPADNSGSNPSTQVMCSRGYIDPSFCVTGELTEASDVYAFGVVLVEVLSERRANEPSHEYRVLASWAREKISERKGHEIVASNLREYISESCLICFLEIVEGCLQIEPEKRPKMTDVFVELIKAHRLQKEWEKQKPEVPPIELIQSGLPHDDITGLLQDNPIQEDEIENREAVLHTIPLADLQDITDNFSSKCMISKRSSAGVSSFYGVLKNGKAAAIKRFDKKLSNQEYEAQVQKLSRLQHANVVRLLGYCVNGDQQVLAFEFAPSVYEILHGIGRKKEPQPALSWAQRIKIMYGAAEGLNHIHESGLIHHDIKSSNILVFEDENAKINNVSLSTASARPCKAAWGPKRYPEQAPCGYCYHPHECVSTNQTQKGDVYSFGVILIEILTGQKPTQKLVQQSLSKLMAAIIASCLAKESDARPAMTTVWRSLRDASWDTEAYYQEKTAAISS
ncbi:serine/threonine-protein kinase BRI1-like 1 isoform X3 [Salvia hispanica]|uniref:serine/threonine-protein kinase BRI1-like 1 isoform X3 n=1 Tax=Salvia hispanica TaxID=49212 RepID=UPI002009ACEF|nr:serine/threonine-protein kinase BRI1-like 1 isoform X3 [Salvia hispanica]